MAESTDRPSPDLWAGVECTVNRVGERYFDQLVRTGHDRRDSDLGLIADLGARTVRYPVLWERTAPDSLDQPQWDWPDRRLHGLRDLGIEPIVGLMHHGSGPRYASLLDSHFAKDLATYAGLVARRYPWVTAFTPVNEPLTTARFAALYGHWYPHRSDDRSFARALVNQCHAIVRAMDAVRRVTPEARLIATEDLSWTGASPSLQYQADFENERRWLSFDLLCGRVDRTHPMRHWLRYVGIEADVLEWFLDHPCPPDILGCNYYVTSERYLDERIALWPAHTHGGNGRERYADVEAVRAVGLIGLERLLVAAWRRFRIPLAVTESHLACTREEQLRWFADTVAQASAVAARGIPVRAVTAWAVFGAYDWDSLLTRDGGSYEPGVYDVRGPAPRATALAAAVRAYARGEPFDHPVMDGPGWWQARRLAARAAA